MSNCWYDYNINFDPAKHDHEGDRVLEMLIGYGSYNGQESYTWQMQILEIKYRKFTFDTSTIVTPEKYVKISITKPEQVLYGKVTI